LEHFFLTLIFIKAEKGTNCCSTRWQHSMRQMY